MRTYEFKRGHRKTLDEIEYIMREIFGYAERKGEKIISRYKGLKRIVVWLEGKMLAVETESRQVKDKDAMDTIKAWNDFLFRVTGYTAKERKKKLTKG